MSFPKLMLRPTVRAFLVVALLGALHAAPARAETNDSATKLALLTPPTPPATSTVALVDTPRATGSDVPTAPKTARTPWWPWLLIAAGAAGVAALVFTSAGKDPACPSGRTCQ
jgi:hypothetical protein